MGRCWVKRDADFYHQIELSIRQILEQNLARTFFLEEIVSLVFPKEINIQRNHKLWVSVALKKVAPSLNWKSGVSWKLGGKIVYFNAKNDHSRRNFNALRGV